MNKKITSEIAVGVILLIAIAIGGIFWLNSEKEIASLPSQDSSQPITGTGKKVGMANPASVFCEKNGGKSEIVNNPDGSQGGDCVFENGSKCEEWAYFRGQCAPTGESAPIRDVVCTQEAKLCEDGKTYVSRTGPNCEFAPCPNK